MPDQQAAGDPGVFAGDEGHVPEHVEGAKRDIAEIPDRRRDHEQDSAGRANALARQLRDEPGLRRG
jgi:hypothetical protein